MSEKRKIKFVNGIKIGFVRKIWNRFWYFVGYFGPGNSLRVFANKARGVKIRNENEKVEKFLSKGRSEAICKNGCLL